ncbi:MAG: AAA family ATPase, partial [Dolichospermum sp.]
MQNLHKLLKTENSELAKILRFNLYGLVAILTQANQEYPIDPGIGISEELLQELDELLQHTRLMEEVEDLGELKESPLINDLKLFQLKAAFNNDPELNFYLGTSPIQSQNDGEIWNEIQRKLLRVPEDLAISWREIALKTAQELGAIVDHENLEELPFVRDEIIYPGLNGTVKAKGLCLSQQALLNSEITQNHLSENLYSIAGFLLLYIKFIEIDTDLHHALKSIFSFDVVSLNSKLEQRHQYIDALKDRFYRIQKYSENIDIILELCAWIDIDEAINSLVFIPPAESYSWWGKLQNFLSYGSEGEEIELQPLNVLIGPNGSGKSNLIEAIGLLQATPGN